MYKQYVSQSTLGHAVVTQSILMRTLTGFIAVLKFHIATNVKGKVLGFINHFGL